MTSSSSFDNGKGNEKCKECVRVEGSFAYAQR